MGKIIAVANQKGGVGKTTSAVNIAASLGALGKRVLMCDIDPQGNATSGFGVNKGGTTIYEAIIGRIATQEAIRPTKSKNVAILPCSISLAGAELELVEIPNREQRLKLALASVKDRYDYIIIDCPPSLGLLTLNALTACDTVLVPIQCEFYALEGLSQLIATIRQIKRLYNPRIDIEGVLLTMYDARLNLTTQVADELKKYFAGKIYKTVIPRNVKLSEAPSYGEPVISYDKHSKGALAYLEVAKEIIKANRVVGIRK